MHKQEISSTRQTSVFVKPWHNEQTGSVRCGASRRLDSRFDKSSTITIDRFASKDKATSKIRLSTDEDLLSRQRVTSVSCGSTLNAPGFARQTISSKQKQKFVQFFSKSSSNRRKSPSDDSSSSSSTQITRFRRVCELNECRLSPEPNLIRTCFENDQRSEPSSTSSVDQRHDRNRYRPLKYKRKSFTRADG